MPKPVRKKPAPVFALAPDTIRKRLAETTVIFPTIKSVNPDGSVTFRPGRAVVVSGADMISTAEAANILGCKPDWVARLCDQDKLREGVDWWRIGKRGNYRISRKAVLKLRNDLVVP